MIKISIKTLIVATLAVATVLLVSPAFAQNLVANGDFDIDACPAFPGYGTITDWPCTIGTSGLNTATNNNFANNGVIPVGPNVAFIQTGSLGGSASLYQTISGLQQDATYLLTYYENSAIDYPGIPSLNVTIGSATVVANHVVNPVGAYETYTNPYTLVQSYFMAPANGSYVLSFNMSGDSAGSALLLDDVRIVQSAESIGSVRGMGVGEDVAVTNAVVTGVYSAASEYMFYIEQADRSSGIKVLCSQQPSVTDGTIVSLQGEVATDSVSGEKEITLGSIQSATSGAVLGALGMSNQGVSSWFSGVGLVTQGLLVKTWGRVTAVDGNSQWFYIDDGTGFADGSSVGCSGIRCNYSFNYGAINVGDCVAVTGCAGNDVSINYGVSPPVTTAIPVIRVNSVGTVQFAVSDQPSLQTLTYAGKSCLLFSNRETGIYLNASNFTLVNVEDNIQNISYVITSGGSLFNIDFLSGSTYSVTGSGATYDVQTWSVADTAAH